MTSRVGASFAWDKQASFGTLQSFGVSSLVGTSGLFFFFSGKCYSGWLFVEHIPKKRILVGKTHGLRVVLFFLLNVCHHPHGLSVCCHRPRNWIPSWLEVLWGTCQELTPIFLEPSQKPWYPGLRCVSFRIWGGWTMESRFACCFLFVCFVEVLLPSGSGGTGVSWSSGEPRIARHEWVWSGNTKSFIIGIG